MHIEEHILKDEDFWKSCVTQVHHFFVTGILPESGTHGQTNTISYDKPGPSGSTISNESSFCYCNGPEEVDMITCDNKTCSIEWFHTTCFKICSIPKRKYFCPDCRKLPQFLKTSFLLSALTRGAQSLEMYEQRSPTSN